MSDGDPYADYDYAWKTPAWTVQNPIIIGDGINGYINPGLPDDVTLVHVFGSFLEMDTGRGLEGVLRVRVDKILTHVTSGQQVLGGLVRVIRFKRGGFSIYLPATDDPQLTPAFTYAAQLTVRGQTQEFEFSLPKDTLEVNILTKIPAPA